MLQEQYKQSHVNTLYMYYTVVYHVAATEAYPTLCGADFQSKCCCGGQNIYLLGTNNLDIHVEPTHPTQLVAFEIMSLLLHNLHF